MNCPECKSTKIQKNGKKRGKQNYRCVQCGRQFITEYNRHQGYNEEFKRECLKLYVNGMGFRAIERVKGVHNTTVMAWVKEVGELLPMAYDPETTPQVGELDELETPTHLECIQGGKRGAFRTFVGQKKTKSGSGQQ